MYVPNNNLTASSDKEWLAQEIRERRIPVPSNATPTEVIPWAKKAVARYKQLGTLIPENVDSYPAWKKTMDDWQEFLEKLESLANAPAPAATITSPQNPAKNPATVPNQQHPTRPEPGQPRPEPAKTLPTTGQPPATTVQNCPIPAPPTSSPSLPSVTSPESEPAKDELEYADKIDGFTSDKERLAVARAEFQDHLANRPVRIGKLTPAQQAAIFALMEEGGFSSRAVAKLLSEPPPHGLGFPISKTTVNEWRKHYKLNLTKERQRQAAEAKLRAALEILDKPQDAEAAFQTAAERILKLRILTSDDAPIEQFDQLVATLTTLRKQALAERKQLHAEKSA